MNRIMADHTGQTFDQVEKDTDRDFTMGAQQAKDYGIIDDIITRPPRVRRAHQGKGVSFG